MRRLLFVSCNYASDYAPMVWGTYIRMRMLVQAAARAADAVDLLLFVAPDLLAKADAAGVAASLKREWGVDVAVRFAPRSTRAHGGWASTLRGLFDVRYQQDYGDAGGEEQARAVAAAIAPDTALVVAHRLDAALAVVAGARGRVPIVVNFDDLEHVAKPRRLAREAPSLRAFQHRLEMGPLARAELEVIRRADRSLVCSEGERAHVASLGFAMPVDVIHNAVSFPPADAPRRSDGRTIMFIGSYGYEPNIEAAEALIATVFPLVRARVPDARLLIAGARSERLPSAAQPGPGVEILGFIDDIAAIYERADVTCCAIRAGGGTRIKIIEAAAWQVPTVSTALGAEGLALEEGREILIGESTEALAEACIALLEDPLRARAMGAAARARVLLDYEHDAVVDRIADSYRRTALIKNSEREAA